LAFAARRKVRKNKSEQRIDMRGEEDRVRDIEEKRRLEDIKQGRKE